MSLMPKHEQRRMDSSTRTGQDDGREHLGGRKERRRGQVRRGGCAGHQLASDMHNLYISRTATLNTEANKSNIQMKIFLTFKAFLILIRSQGEKNILCATAFLKSTRFK